MDIAAARVRHATKPKRPEVLELLEKDCKGQVSFVKSDRGQDSTAQAVEPDKGQGSTMQAEMIGVGQVSFVEAVLARRAPRRP